MDPTEPSPRTTPATGRAGGRAEATRAAILDAARQSFGAAGYDQVGIRDVAALAGVDPALVIRYFGSKEQLFSAAVAAKFDMTELFAGDRSGLGERLVQAVLCKPVHPGGFDPLVALLRSAPNERPATLLRGGLEHGFVAPLANLIGGEDAVARAELVGAILLGLLVHRTVVAGARTDAATMAVVAGPAVQRLIDGDAPGSG